MTESVDFQNPAVTGTVAALVTALLAWLGQRLVGKAAIQEAINKSFHELMEQLRTELRVALAERDKARGDLEACERQIEELRRTLASMERCACHPLRTP